MNRNMKPALLGAALLSFGLMSGCAHVHKVDGQQEKSEIPAGVRVGIGGKEVKEGDSVLVYKSVCKKVQKVRGGDYTSCNDQIAGKAVVLKVLDHDSAIVEPKDGLVIDTTMTVEKEGG